MNKKELFGESIRLARRFPEKVITHAVKNKEIFLKILRESKIRLPSQIKRGKKMTPFMEKALGVDNCIYLGVGFVYNSSHHHWKYAFIFNKNILLKKEITTYAAFLISNAWLRFLRKLKQEDPASLLKIRNKNDKTRKEIDQFFKTDRCNWFYIEKELSELFSHYKNKEEHIKYMRKFQKFKTIKNSYALRYMAKDYDLNPNFKKFEAISKKPLSLKDRNFIGVYIHNSDKKTIEYAKKLLSGENLIYTGKKIIKVRR